MGSSFVWGPTFAKKLPGPLEMAPPHSLPRRHWCWYVQESSGLKPDWKFELGLTNYVWRFVIRMSFPITESNSLSERFDLNENSFIIHDIFCNQDVILFHWTNFHVKQTILIKIYLLCINSLIMQEVTVNHFSYQNINPYHWTKFQVKIKMR